jgi:hypothetical protein
MPVILSSAAMLRADAELLDDITALPARLHRAIREQQADAEILITWIQLAIVLLFSLVYAAAPKAFPEMSRFEPSASRHFKTGRPAEASGRSPLSPRAISVYAPLPARSKGLERTNKTVEDLPTLEALGGRGATK